jgi:hypothetical protein
MDWFNRMVVNIICTTPSIFVGFGKNSQQISFDVEGLIVDVDKDYSCEKITASNERKFCIRGSIQSHIHWSSS